MGVYLQIYFTLQKNSRLKCVFYALYYCEKITQGDWLNYSWTFLPFFSPNNFNMMIFKKEKKKSSGYCFNFEVLQLH